MKIVKQPNGDYQVQSRTNKTKFWTVSGDLRTCTCPKWKYYLKSNPDVPCHHIEEVRTSLQDTRITPGQWEKAKYNRIMNVDEFIEKFGKLQLDHLIRTFEVVIMNFKVRKL